MSRTSVLIVSWNVREQLEDCLNSLRQAQPLEIIVVDNNSADGSAEMVSSIFPAVKLLKMSTNLGFAKAVNVAMAEARGEFFLLLNPDASIGQHSIISAEAFFDQNTKTGIVGGKLFDEAGNVQPSVRKLPSLFSQFVVLTKLQYILPFLLNNYLMKSFNYNLASPVEQVSGALFFIRRALWENIGKFDEGFWLWFEEVDYCARAHKNGWKVYYFPEASARHVGGSSFKQLSHAARQRQFNKSLLYYFKKHSQLHQVFILSLASLISLFQAKILDLSARIIHGK